MVKQRQQLYIARARKKGDPSDTAIRKQEFHAFNKSDAVAMMEGYLVSEGEEPEGWEIRQARRGLAHRRKTPDIIISLAC